MKISVIIITRNRHEQLTTCLKSLSKSIYKNYEVIIIDQSNTYLQNTAAELQFNKNTIYIPSRLIGKTKGSNIALTMANGDILSFIDDDNIVSYNWLSKIYSYFKNHPNRVAVFGKILPYQPKKHTHEISPACFEHNTSRTISNPYTIFYSSVGLGSNMSIRKTTTQSLGGFKEWLGPGNYGFSGGEDGEYITRMLLYGMTLAYDPQIVVYHTRWLSPKHYTELTVKYTGGEVAYGIYYFLQGHTFFGLFAVHTLLYRIKMPVTKDIFTVLHHPHKINTIRNNAIFAMKNNVFQIYYALKGAFVAFYFYLNETQKKQI